MSEQNLYANYIEMIKAIEHCVDNRLLLPALVMIYTSIDSVSWLANNNPKLSVKDAFTKWVDEWMLKNQDIDKLINCSSKELYAARCGLLHTLTPESDLTQRGVRKTAYSWGKAENSKLEELIVLQGQQNQITAVNLETLLNSFREAMADYLDHVYNNKELKDHFLEKAKLHFATLSIDKVDSFLSLNQKMRF